MEVLSFITSNAEVIDLFKEFIHSYDKLLLQKEDNDTSYFSKNGDNRLEIYYHYQLNDVSEEFSYNYTKEDVDKIRSYFADKELFIFDLSFRDENFLREMIDDFQQYLHLHEKKHLISDVLLSHPFTGIIQLLNNNKAAHWAAYVLL